MRGKVLNKQNYSKEEGMDSLFAKMERSINFYYNINTFPQYVDKDWFDRTINLQIKFRNKLYPEAPFKEILT